MPAPELLLAQPWKEDEKDEGPSSACGMPVSGYMGDGDGFVGDADHSWVMIMGSW